MVVIPPLSVAGKAEQAEPPLSLPSPPKAGLSPALPLSRRSLEQGLPDPEPFLFLLAIATQSKARTLALFPRRSRPGQDRREIFAFLIPSFQISPRSSTESGRSPSIWSTSRRSSPPSRAPQQDVAEFVDVSTYGAAKHLSSVLNQHADFLNMRLYGGSKEAAASIIKDAEIVLKLGSTPDKREQYRLTRDAMGKRFIQVTRGSIVGGVRLGMFTSTFYGLNHLLADIREVHDVFCVTGAGSATAAIFGLILPGSVKWRGSNALLGSVLEAGICFPLGWLHMKLIEKTNKQMIPSNMTQAMNTSVVSAAKERLEGGGRASSVMVVGASKVVLLKSTVKRGRFET
ncbi:hypothetical protein KSP39_PZI000621 [Platanthera zijinensis]|uniref:Complex I assembly factor TIMMDC1, mitochondrial n=1 Tax=Platanthera zijinensis TaxID=2320716 RepID=A0AAP0C1Q5_9ASPA